MNNTIVGVTFCLSLIGFTIVVFFKTSKICTEHKYYSYFETLSSLLLFISMVVIYALVVVLVLVVHGQETLAYLMIR